MDDTYQPPFKSCVLDGNVASVMCSYNQVNGKPTCGDPDLLTGVIRGQWKLNGYISSDCDSLEVMLTDQHWEKTPEQVAADALIAGLDLNCGSFLGQHTEAAIKAGLVKESEVDRAVSNNFATLMRLGFFDGHPSKHIYGNLGPKDVCTPANQELAREAARQGIVLLKNSVGSLPLSPTAIKSLAVIGPNANATRTMIGNYEDGRLPMSWYPQFYTKEVRMTNMNMRPDPATGYPGRTYRFYQGHTVYTFGDGLSFSDFTHHLVKAPKLISVPLEEGHVCQSSACKSIDIVDQTCTNLAFNIHLRVTNNGTMRGSHTVLLFFSPPSVHGGPQKHLLGFQKVHLASRQQSLVKFSVDVCKELSLVDEDGNRKVALGLHVLHIGNLKHSLHVRI